jgi:SAM-dependent methyltransferase
VNAAPWSPSGLDISRPNPARVYDYYLGGYHNFAADREMARKALQMWPELPTIMRANRAFLRRAVTYLAESGVRQFLDIGSGIPTVDNVHAVAQECAPDAHVVYVDIDPVAVQHSRAILADDDCTAVIQADLRQPLDVLGKAKQTGLLDFDRPIALLVVALLHFLPDVDRPREALAAYRDALPPGSCLAISHATHEGQPELSASHQELYRRMGTPMTMRSHDEVAAFFEGYELVEPGLVYLLRWRPGPEEAQTPPETVPAWVGVGRRS